MLIGLMGLVVLTASSCKNECKKVECVNGACVEGNCLCNPGWTGANCDQVDECYQRTCVNGYCADGSCVCDPLYEGNTCSTPINFKFSNSGWWVTDSSAQYQSVDFYQVTFTPDASILNKFYIYNLYNDSRTIEAFIGSDNLTFSFERQFIYQWFPYFTYSAESVSAAMDVSHYSGHITYDVYDASADTLIERRIATFMHF